MSLLDYTTYADIRAALGVNDVELPDETLGLALYSSNLAVELDELDTTLDDQYQVVRQIDAAARTKVQQRFFNVTRTFATYTVARQCGGSLPMFGPKSISDAKTELSRFTNDPYKATIANIGVQWSTYRSRVADALAGLKSTVRTASTLTVMAVSKPTVDAVTGS